MWIMKAWCSEPLAVCEDAQQNLSLTHSAGGFIGQNISRMFLHSEEFDYWSAVFKSLNTKLKVFTFVDVTKRFV